VILSTGSLVQLGRLPDPLRVRGVVDAERLPVVVRDVREDPGDAALGVGADDRQARLDAR